MNKYVNTAGKVNYNGIKNSNALKSVLQNLQEGPEADWTKNEKLAYWLNVYNAFTLAKIVDNYPIKSITALNNGKPWDDKFINIQGKKYSLNDIENDQLRDQFKDPRIHFGINCASKSCPALYNKAFTAENVESALDSRTKLFLNDKLLNNISEDKLEVSSIFDWFQKDFGNVIAFINKYSSSKIKSNAQIKYKDYDWMLNE